MWLARFRKKKSKGEGVAPTKEAVELLYSRQVNVPGIILSDVIPAALKLPAQPSEQTLHASLYANNRHNRYALLDYDKIASRDGYVFVSGEASLLSQTFNRDLLVQSRAREGQVSLSNSSCARNRARKTKHGRIDKGDGACRP